MTAAPIARTPPPDRPADSPDLAARVIAYLAVVLERLDVAASLPDHEEAGALIEVALGIEDDLRAFRAELAP